MLNIIPLWFIRYKFFNSLFLGVSVGAVFTLYAPLEPSVYSLGGIALATGMLIVAQFYSHILNTRWFFIFSFFTEAVMLCVILYFLYISYSYQTALLIYVGYQITFVFGSYLVRAETLLLQTDTILTKLDTAKQLGYLVGMGLSYLFYRVLKNYGVQNSQEQVYLLHFLLLNIEVVVLVLIWKSFKRG